MKRGVEIQDTIYSGLDESNHGRFPEFFIVVFSTVKQDIELVDFNYKERDIGVARRWLEKGLREGTRDYRFIGLEEKDLAKRGIQKVALPYVASQLIRPYISQHPCRRLNIYVDGEISAKEVHLMRTDLEDISTSVHIQECVKHVSKERKVKQPLIVRVADIIVHDLFDNSRSVRKLKEYLAEKQIYWR